MNKDTIASDYKIATTFTNIKRLAILASTLSLTDDHSSGLLFSSSLTLLIVAAIIANL